MTTKDKLLEIAAQCEQLRILLHSIGKPIREGGANDISFAASHEIGTIMACLEMCSRKLTRVSGNLS